MSDGAPKDLNLGQIVAEAKQVLPQINPELEKARVAFESISKQIANGGAPELHAKVVALQAGIDSGILSTEQFVSGVQALIHQFAFPLAIAGGMKIQGSGQIEGAYKGLQTTLTDAQKKINTIIPIVQGVVLVAGFALATFPQLGAWAPVGGLTLAKIVGILGTYLNVKNSNYSDAPRAQLVSLPKS